MEITEARRPALLAPRTWLIIILLIVLLGGAPAFAQEQHGMGGPPITGGSGRVDWLPVCHCLDVMEPRLFEVVRLATAALGLRLPSRRLWKYFCL